MFNFIKNAFKSVKDGNEYRLAKYGPADTMAESFEKARIYCENKKTNAPKVLSMFALDAELKEIENFKSKFHYWDTWTGARFHREENPYYGTLKGKNINHGSICKSDPVTGYWKAL